MNEIDELEGAEMDEAVALAQGWVKYLGVWITETSSGRCWHEAVESYHPHRNIEQAWELVEAMMGDGYRLDPLRHSTLGFAVAYIARFIHEDGDGLPWEAGFIGQGYTAPTAICRAFLLVKAKEVEQ